MFVRAAEAPLVNVALTLLLSVFPFVEGDVYCLICPFSMMVGLGRRCYAMRLHQPWMRLTAGCPHIICCGLTHLSDSTSLCIGFILFHEPSPLTMDPGYYTEETALVVVGSASSSH